jgi:hypothetical protein
METKRPGRPVEVAFLFDIDNTLLDNDRVTADLKGYLKREVGPRHARRYWSIFEGLREQVGYADYLGALQRCRLEYPHALQLLKVSSFLIDYPFANRLFPRSLDAIEHVGLWGPAIILSDGDVVFQPRKAERSGLHAAVGGRVLIFVHKELELAEVERRFPARHYVLIDDKIRILNAVKRRWKDRVTTVFVRQGHYALDPQIVSKYPPADVSIERIGDLLGLGRAQLGPGTARRGRRSGGGARRPSRRYLR